MCICDCKSFNNFFTKARVVNLVLVYATIAIATSTFRTEKVTAYAQSTYVSSGDVTTMKRTPSRLTRVVVRKKTHAGLYLLAMALTMPSPTACCNVSITEPSRLLGMTSIFDAPSGWPEKGSPKVPEKG